MDHLTPRGRSANMAKIRSRDTKPEIVVRRICWGLGYRYRLHAKDLPERPDLVFRPLQKVIFVNGCFWHQHRGCSRSHVPKTRREYWIPKLTGNKRRDALNKSRLTRMGWKYLVVWECRTSDPERLLRLLSRFLSS